MSIRHPNNHTLPFRKEFGCRVKGPGIPLGRMRTMDYPDPALMKRLGKATGRSILFSWAILESMPTDKRESFVQAIEQMAARPQARIGSKVPEWSGPWPGGPKNSELREFDSPPKST